MDALIVEGSEALRLARELAERQGLSVGEAVMAALRTSVDEPPQRDHRPQPPLVPALDQMTPEQRARYESSRAWVHEIAGSRVPGGTSDHDEMYDERGLPV